MKNRRRSRRSVRALPDDLIMEILSRLPANDVLEFRRVCRKWRVLLSSQYFAQMHLKACSSPMILVSEEDELSLLDRWEPPRKRPTIRKVSLNFIHDPSSCLFRLSYDGLIVVEELGKKYRFGRKSRVFFVFNPILRDMVRIKSRICKFDIYGMFFNPLIKEYCILWGSFEKGPNVQFKILNLGAQPCCRDVKQPASSLKYKPRGPITEAPVVINDATIYWIVEYCYNDETHFDDYSPYVDEFLPCEELILAFDVKTEEFTLMPHPGPTDDCCYDPMHFATLLFKMNGHLSLLNYSTRETNSCIMHIWTLTDSATRLWTKSHRVSIDIHLRTCSFHKTGFWDGIFHAIAAVKGELLLGVDESFCSCNQIIHACNLELGTFRVIGRTYKFPTMSSHVPSFVSLRNCKSQIRI